MRVTQSMLSNNMLRNLSNSYSRLGKLQDQISSQKKFTKPSDDPVAAIRGMGYRTDLNRIQQYQRNITEVRNLTDSTDDALDKSISALQRIRELTVQASSGTLEETQRSYIATEIEQLQEHLSNLGDTQVGGKYIFNGTKTNERPSENGFSGGTIEIEVFTGIKLPANTDGSGLFGELLKPGGDLENLITDLNGNSANIGDNLAKLDAQIDNFLTARSNIGARQTRIDLMEDRLAQQEVFSTRILSDNEDVDMEKVITELTTQESVQRAALSVGARIIQPSLMDFLR